MNRRLLLLSALVLAWLVGMAAAFTWSIGQRLRPFARGDQLLAPVGAVDLTLGRPQADQPSVATLIHYRDPACGCSLPNDDHVARIAAQYAGRGVRFVLVEVPDADRSRPLRVPWSRTLTPTAAGLPKVPSTPAAVVLDSTGQVAYFGPYSEGAGCFTGGGKFVEDTLERVLAGGHPRRVNLLASGCYCPSRNG